VAIWDQGSARGITYRELSDLVDRRRSELGPVEGSLVFLGASTEVDTIVTYLALIGAGATLALLDPAVSTERLTTLCESYSPDLVMGLPRIDLDHRAAGGHALDDRILLSTSGSTGSPKFVRLSEMAIEASSRQIVAAAQISEQDRALLSLPLHYSFGLSVLNSHLMAGAGVVIGSQASMSPSFATELVDCHVTNLFAVPFSIEIFRRTALFDGPLGSLRSVTVSGSRLASDLTLSTHESLSNQGVDLIIRYGATEATSAISMLPADALPQHVGSVGAALPGITVSVSHVDESGVGDLQVAGPNVMLGYATSRDDLGSGSATGGVIDIGDQGRIDSEGLLWISGRASRFAKIRGLRISLDELESELAGTIPCAAVEGADQVVLFVEASDSPPPRARDLERQLGLRPGTLAIELVTTLPRTPSGKVDRKLLDPNLGKGEPLQGPAH